MMKGYMYFNNGDRETDVLGKVKEYETKESFLYDIYLDLFDCGHTGINSIDDFVSENEKKVEILLCRYFINPPENSVFHGEGGTYMFVAEKKQGVFEVYWLALGEVE